MHNFMQYSRSADVHYNGRSLIARFLWCHQWHECKPYSFRPFPWVGPMGRTLVGLNLGIFWQEVFWEHLISKDLGASYPVVHRHWGQPLNFLMCWNHVTQFDHIECLNNGFIPESVWPSVRKLLYIIECNIRLYSVRKCVNIGSYWNNNSKRYSERQETAELTLTKLETKEEESHFFYVWGAQILDIRFQESWCWA
jgi:hypothetical protein